jgi:hypothetical protein
MSTAQRVSRGFHRLGLFLAAIPLQVGGAWSIFAALNEANYDLAKHQQLVCAHERVAKEKPGENIFNRFDSISLKEIGCSDGPETLTVDEARNNPPDFNWLPTFGPGLVPGLPITLALTLAIYLLVRAIGWVIGGFAAS